MNIKHYALLLLSVAVMSSVSYAGERGSPPGHESSIKISDVIPFEAVAFTATMIVNVLPALPAQTPVAENIATFDADAAEALNDRSEAVATVLITHLSGNNIYNYKEDYQIRGRGLSPGKYRCRSDSYRSLA